MPRSVDKKNFTPKKVRICITIVLFNTHFYVGDFKLFDYLSLKKICRLSIKHNLDFGIYIIRATELEVFFLG